MYKKLLFTLLVLSFVGTSSKAMLNQSDYFIAVKNGDVNYFRLLKQSYPENIETIVNTYNLDGILALHYACKHGHLALTAFLLSECNANPLAPDFQHKNALYYVQNQLIVELQKRWPNLSKRINVYQKIRYLLKEHSARIAKKLRRQNCTKRRRELLVRALKQSSEKRRSQQPRRSTSTLSRSKSSNQSNLDILDDLDDLNDEYC